MVTLRTVALCCGALILLMTGIISVGRTGADDEAYFLLFTSSAPQNRGVYRVNPDGGDLTLLSGPGRRSRWMRWLSSNVSEAVSPDGQWIVFHRETFGGIDLFIRRSDGSDERPLVEAPQSDAYPQWSPDGTRIMFIRYLNLESLAISDIAPEGGQPRQLSTARFSFVDDARYSPDGRWIAFSSGFDGMYSIYRIPADGSDRANEVVRLTEQGSSSYSPGWSPDGRWIAFVSDRDGSLELYRMRADGSDVMRLTDNASSEQTPVWSPNYAREWQPGIGAVVGVAVIAASLKLQGKETEPRRHEERKEIVETQK